MNTKELKKIRIVDFCNQNGIGIRQDSREYYRLEAHDSCVISDKKNLFKWNSKNEGGDIFDFVQSYYNCSFKEAKQKLMDNEYEVHEYVNKPKNEPFEYERDNEAPVTVAKDYLVNNRRINEKLVDDMIAEGLVRQDKRGNVLFVWKNKDNEIVGCTERGTRQFFHKDKQKMVAWKKIQENSKEYSGFKVSFGKPKDMYFFESEIDLMSYITQKPEKANNATFVSMNGLKFGTVLQAVTENYNENKSLAENIYLCVDNDEAGRTFAETEFKGREIGREDVGYTKIKIDLPVKNGFDWNDNLTKGAKIIQDMKQEDLSKIINFSQKKHMISKSFSMESV